MKTHNFLSWSHLWTWTLLIGMIVSTSIEDVSKSTKELSTIIEEVSTPKELINKPVIIVISTFRSGSSFTGEIFRFPGSIYFFEPFHFFGIVTRTPKEGYAMDMFESLISCDFNYLFNQLYWFDVRFVVKLAPKKWKDILGKNLSFYNGKIPRKVWKENWRKLTNYCLNSTGIVMKTVRLRMDTMAKLYEELDPDRKKNVHVLFNVRDPRSVINSRRKFKWCNQKNKCIRSDTLCQDVVSDYETYQNMKSKYPNNFHFQKFEDLIDDPNSYSSKLVYSMGLNHTKKLAEFIHSHTSKDAKPAHAYDTHRYSKAIQNRWTWEMNIDWIRRIENDCKKMFDLFGYEIL